MYANGTNNPRRWANRWTPGNGLGVDPVTIAAAVQTAGGLIKVSKDAERLRRNTTAYRAALQGNTDALRYLWVRSGRDPSVRVTTERNSFRLQLGEVEPNWGWWGSDEARQDAGAKYDAAAQGIRIEPPAVVEPGVVETIIREAAKTPIGKEVTEKVAGEVVVARAGEVQQQLKASMPILLGAGLLLAMLMGRR